MCLPEGGRGGLEINDRKSTEWWCVGHRTHTSQQRGKEEKNLLKNLINWTLAYGIKYLGDSKRFHL